MSFMSEISLIENLTSKENQFLVARTILTAQDIKEDSWNGEKYLKTDLQATIEACKQYKLEDFWINIIVDFNCSSWNDIQDWAQSIIEENME